jgi:hypothetical protein
MSDTEKPAPELQLMPAHDNVWYWVATLHGEQNGKSIDHDIAERNRAAWLRWFAPQKHSKLHRHLLDNGFSQNELEPFTIAERTELLTAYARRLGRDAPLSELPLSKPVNFCHTHFKYMVSFRGFLFDRPVDFSGAKFSERVVFDDATLLDLAYFIKTEFSGGAKFRKTTFSKRADFGETNFLELVTFHEARFSGIANFNDVRFSKDAHFQRANFAEEARFQRAKFSKRADFINAYFGAETVFSDTTFETHVPDFLGATLHDATKWYETNWPPVPKTKNSCQSQVDAYARLKQEMERLKKHEDEQRFFRMEMLAKHGLLEPWSGKWLLDCGYKLVSDYGESVGRPLVGFALVFYFCFIVFWAEGFIGARMSPWHALALSFSSLFAIVPSAAKIVADQHDELAGGLRLFAVLESFTGALLLFLLGLALRNRFRMK